MTEQVINLPPWDGTQRDIALVWRLRKNKRYAECRLFTHPLKAEIRVEAAGQFVRSQAGADPLALVDLALTWKAQFEQKGWTP